MASARPALQGSCSEQETPDGQSRFVIPSTIDDCDDMPSLSLHRLPYASQRSQAGLDRISDDQDQDDGTHSEEEEMPKFQPPVEARRRRRRRRGRRM